jgi:hypothetical protein
MSNGNTPPPRSYERSSQNIEFIPDGGGGGTLNALCRKINGEWVQSSLKYDIPNCDGVLEWAPNGC